MGFLIPANSKKSLLIFGLFTPFDLILFGSGVGITTLLLLTLPVEQLSIAVLALMPALICGFLVLPIPNYHNMITIIKNAIDFFTNRQRFVWKGWCVLDEETKQK
ncbi:MAG: hypothetical protein PHN72_01090 [Bacilli bacterium]|nr:hypothetical protein [Bacilli bacterium]